MMKGEKILRKFLLTTELLILVFIKITSELNLTYRSSIFDVSSHDSLLFLNSELSLGVWLAAIIEWDNINWAHFNILRRSLMLFHLLALKPSLFFLLVIIINNQGGSLNIIQG